MTTSSSLGTTETESNDTSSNADTLTSGTEISGQMYSSEDVDWFAITTTAAGSLDVSFDAPTNSSGDYFGVTIYNTNGDVVASHKTGEDITFSVGTETAGTYKRSNLGTQL